MEEKTFKVTLDGGFVAKEVIGVSLDSKMTVENDGAVLTVPGNTGCLVIAKK